MNETIDVLTRRRSCKAFIDKKVAHTILEEITKCGVNAPTGRNMQSPVIVAIEDENLVKKLSKMNASIMGAQGDPFYGAKTVIVVLADKTKSTYIYDGSLVMGNMLNACEALNIGACWIHRAKEMFETNEGKELLKEFGLNENYEGIGNLVIGYPAKEPVSKEHKKDYVIFK